jgi:serine/threonine-protein kinase
LAVELSRRTVLRDEYALLERIGTHAGDVFRARHVRDRRSVIVRIYTSDNTASLTRWLERAQVASRVRHPVLPAIEAWERYSKDTAYVVSEYADGERLDQYADRVGIPPIANVIELFRHLCIGLNAAHRNALAHEALHPRNILVTELNQDGISRLAPRVLDLAVPAFMYRFPPYLQTGQFMAPERLAEALNKDARTLPPADVRTNVYGCGALLYWMCTGGAPIQGRTLEEMARTQALGRLLPASRINPQVPPALDAVILRALSFEASERYPSMAELALALERVNTGSSASGVRPRVLPPVEGAFRRRRHTTSKVSFDERPTSEAPRAILKTPMRPPPPESAAQPPPPPASAERKSEPPQRGAPIGLFSTPPPAPAAAAPLDAPAQHAPARDPAVEGASLRGLERVVFIPDATRATLRARATRLLAIVAAALVPIALVWIVRAARAPEPARAPHAAAGSSAVTRAVEPAALAPARAEEAPRAPAAVVPGANSADAVQVGARDESLAEAPRVARNRGWHPAAASAHKPSSRASEPTGTGAEDDPLRAETKADPLLDIDPRAGAITAHGPPDPAARTSDSADAPSAASSEPPPSSDAQASADAERSAHHAGAAHEAAHASMLPASFHARAQSDDLVVHGSLPTSVVRRAVDRLATSLAACYTRVATAAGRNVFGALNVEIEIDEHGHARDAQVSGAQLPGLGSCVAQAAAHLAADRAPDTGRVKASWKVVFTP